MRRGVALALLLTACASPQPSPPPQDEPPAVVRDVRLLADCGGFVPPDELIAAASALGDVPGRAEAIAALMDGPAARRVEVLRAGLRLADLAAARACAARLTYQQMDRWECARCVDLLVDDVLKPGSEANFEEFRQYVGSVELARLLRSLPPQPWTWPPRDAFGALHRISMGRHVADYLALTSHEDAAVVEAAWSQVDFLGYWNDDDREEAALRKIESAGFTRPHDEAGPGLPSALAAWLRCVALEPALDLPSDGRLPDEKLRWCWESTPGPRDRDLLVGLAERYRENEVGAGVVALILLGKLDDAESDAYLRRRAADESRAAVLALARRHDAAMVDLTASRARDGDAFALAALMETDPARARRLIEETLLGPDADAAGSMIDDLASFAAPGACKEPLGFDWRRTSFAGFERAAIGSGVSGTRLATIGIVVPGCRTRTLAEAAATRLRPGDLDPESQQDAETSLLGEVAAFLETAAPDTLRASLRRIQAGAGGDAERAVRWLVRMGDADAAAAFIEANYEIGWMSWRSLARTRSPAVRMKLEAVLRDWLALGSAEGPPVEEVEALAVWHGVSEDARHVFDDCVRGDVELVLAGRPLDAIASVLAATPDARHGVVGAVDDPRVRAYLARLRERREVDGAHWYATGQLAVLGDPAARAELWGAMQDGRYRIMDEAEEFERTLGWDIEATMAFWIDELRSQCCRIVTGAAGDIVEDLLGVEGSETCRERTPHRRAMEVWDAAGGRFVRSRILSDDLCPRFVPAPK